MSPASTTPLPSRSSGRGPGCPQLVRSATRSAPLTQWSLFKSAKQPHESGTPSPFESGWHESGTPLASQSVAKPIASSVASHTPF